MVLEALSPLRRLLQEPKEPTVSFPATTMSVRLWDFGFNHNFVIKVRESQRGLELLQH